MSLRLPDRYDAKNRSPCIYKNRHAGFRLYSQRAFSLLLDYPYRRFLFGIIPIRYPHFCVFQFPANHCKMLQPFTVRAVIFPPYSYVIIIKRLSSLDLVGFHKWNIVRNTEVMFTSKDQRRNQKILIMHDTHNI